MASQDAERLRSSRPCPRRRLHVRLGGKASSAKQGRALLEAMGFSKEELEEHCTNEDAREHLGRNLGFTYGSVGGRQGYHLEEGLELVPAANATGFSCVKRKRSKYEAVVTVRGIYVHLGNFVTAEEVALRVARHKAKAEAEAAAAGHKARVDLTADQVDLRRDRDLQG